MRIFELKGETRPTVGKKGSKAVRKAGAIPCVIYGGNENIHFSSIIADFRHLVYTPHVYQVAIQLEDKKYNAIVKDMQFHPVSDEILHVDFLEVVENKKMVMTIPVELVGTSKGVLAGGKVQVVNRKIKVRGLITEMPDVLNVDITDVDMGGTIKVGQLEYPNLEILDSKNAVVMTVKSTRAAKAVTK